MALEEGSEEREERGRVPVYNKREVGFPFITLTLLILDSSEKCCSPEG